MRYPVTLTPDDNGTLLATFPDFPDAVTFGEDAEDALQRASDALNEVIASRMASRLDVPLPGKRRSKHYASPAPLTEAKALLYREMQQGNVRRADLARLLSVQQGQVDRLLDVHHRSSINDLAKAFGVLGKRIEIGIGAA